MATMERLVIELPSDLVKGLRSAMQSAGFESESELFEFLLRQWRGEYEIEEPDIETLRAFVAEGIADADAGRVVPAEQVYAELRGRIKAIAANKER